MKYKVIAIMGKSASGKDTILNAFCDSHPSVNKIISTTTRPPREGEQDRVDYFYIDIPEFTQRVLNGHMLEACEFNDWFYGTEIRALKEDKVNVGVFNPAGIEALSEDKRIDLVTIWVHVSDKQRLIRSLNREEDPNVSEIIRRYGVDNSDFSNIDFDYYNISNDDGTELDGTVEKIKHIALTHFGQS